jgi:hypothetical protein
MPGMTTFHIDSPLGGGAKFGTGSVSSVRGERGLGFFRLTVTVDLVIEAGGGAGGGAGGQPYVPPMTELMAEARIGGKLTGRFTPVPGCLPVWSYPAGQSNRHSIPLTCDLDRARVEAIEDARAGANLLLDLSLGVVFGNGWKYDVSDQYIVNQSMWIDVLDAMGYQRTLLVEVPMPDPNAQPEFAEAVDLLAQSRRHLQRGQDREAVGSLRDVLEQIRLAVGDDDTLDPDLTRVLFANSRSMTKGERLRVLRRALMLVTHPARHRDQVSVAIDWSRMDATQMIAMTAAFVNEMSAPDARPPQSQSAQ